jgi:hypothetical protein
MVEEMANIEQQKMQPIPGHWNDLAVACILSNFMSEILQVW